MSEIITRADAKARGIKYFFTGQPCSNGHVSERYVSAPGNCRQCALDRARARYVPRPRVPRKASGDPAERAQRALDAKEKRAAYRAEYRAKNRDGIRAYMAEYRAGNAEKIAAYRAENHEYFVRYRELNRERRSAYNARYRKDNGEKLAASSSLWLEKNRAKVMEYRLRYKRERYAASPEYKCSVAMRRYLYRTLNSAELDKKGKSAALLGYTSEQLVAHIERQFKKGMTWENYGEWHIDHVTPISVMIAAGITDPAKVNCLSNLQPMWAAENLSKGSKILALL